MVLLAATSQCKEKFEDYEGFVEKFKPKRTTDDCYTPDIVYEAVKDWACEEYGINPDSIVRPFWPGGDYETFDYPEGCTVLDNPPFSCMIKIIRFYNEKGIKYFLFAPYLSNFNSGFAANHIITGTTITYENGAEIGTSFLTNLGEWFIRSAPELADKIEVANKENLKAVKKHVPKYSYPDAVISSAAVGYICNHGVELKIRRKDCTPIRALDSQREKRKTIFGGGSCFRNGLLLNGLLLTSGNCPPENWISYAVLDKKRGAV